MSTFHSHGPVVRRGPLKMTQSVEVGGKRTMMPFEREVLWIRQSESQVRITHRGVEVDERGTYCDGRLGTSVTSAIDAAIGAAKELKIDAWPTELCVEVLARLYDTPGLPSDEPSVYGDTEYLCLPRMWRHAEPVTGKTTWPSGDPFYPPVEDVDVEPWSLVWTTAEHDLSNPEPAHILELIERWRKEADALNLLCAGCNSRKGERCTRAN